MRQQPEAAQQTMVEHALVERLQPSLLDRLTDNDPGSKAERREDRVIDVPRLREIIQRDLAWLLNTNSNTRLDRKQYPHVADSVINYGVRDVAGQYSTMERAELIRVSLEKAIRMFEPRLHGGSLEVVLRTEQLNNETLVTFDIRSEMWAQPMPLELYLRSEVDVTTGSVKLSRVG